MRSFEGETVRVHRNERGQGATETAVTLSVVALLVLGGVIAFWVWSSRDSDDAKAKVSRTAEPTVDTANVDTAALRFAADTAVLRIEDLPHGWVESAGDSTESADNNVEIQAP